MLVLKVIVTIFAVGTLIFNISMGFSWISHFYISRGKDNYHFDYSGGLHVHGEQQLVLIEIGSFVLAALATILALLSMYLHYALVVNFAIATMFALGSARGIRHQRLIPISHRFHL